MWYLLILLPLSALFLWSLAKRKQKLRQMGDEHLLDAFMPAGRMSRSRLKFIVLVVALFAGIVGLANLQAGSRSAKIERKGIDVMIALDVSRSMLARDASPNRLEKARQLVSKLLDKLGNDRIGLVLFAGRAYVSVPLTVDFSALKMNLATASPEAVPTQGTVLAEAVSMCRQSFNARETKYKSMVLISDGEDHDEDVMKEVKQAVEEGIMINTIGIGSPEGAPLFDEESGTKRTDEDGKEILTKLNEEELQSIAEAGQGIYRRLGNTDAVADAVARQISSTEQRSFGDTIFTDYSSYFQYFLAVALLLMLLEALLPDYKKTLTA